MEAVLAMALFAIVATALVGVLVSGVSAQQLSRQKTIAEQGATAQAEYIRTLAYSAVGNPGGNPNGTIPLSQGLSAVLGNNPGLVNATITSKVEWNNNPQDKVATAYRNAAFYKKVTITVTRADGKVLSTMVTYVSDSGTSTGVGEAEIDLNVVDMGANGGAGTPVVGQGVTLTTGPSATPTPLTDTTDGAGEIVFPALTANPTSGATAFYNLTMTPPSGYTLLKDDDIALTPASTNAHIQLAPSQIFPSQLRIYKGSTINVVLQNASNGTTYSGNATVALSTTLRGSATSQNYSYPSAFPATMFSAEKIIPSPSNVATGGYTASVSNGFWAPAVTNSTVPNNYPSDLTSTFTLSGYQTATLSVTVMSGGSPVSGATVSVTNGPAAGAGWSTPAGTTNGSGVATFTDVPVGSGYTITATKGGQGPTSITQTVVAPSTSATVTFPTGSLLANVTWGASGPVAPGVSVTLTGGPTSVNVSGTTNASGQVTFSSVPAGSGYIVTAKSGAQTLTSSSQTVAPGPPPTTTVSLAIPVGSILSTVKWGASGPVVAGASVQLSGPNGYSQTLSPTSGAGQVTFSNVPAGSGYTLVATKSGQSTSPAVAATVTSGSTAPYTVPIGGTATISVTVNWASQGVNAAVTITGGPDGGSYGGTAVNGVFTATVPASPSAGFPYVVGATKNNGAPSPTTQSIATIAVGATSSPVFTLLPTKNLVITVKQNGVNLASGTAVTLSITGGPGGTIGALPAWGGALTVNASSQVTVTVPQGTGAFTYTIRAYRTGCGTVRSGVIAAISDSSAVLTATVNMATATCPGTTP